MGRVVSERNFSSHSLQSNIERLLRSVKGFQFRSLGDNRFLLHFSHPLDRTHVMEGSPWLLDNSALLFSLILQEEDPETMEKNLMTIGVKLNNIPLGYRNPSAARRLCTNLGEVLEVIPPKCETPQVYIRVRVRIDIQESLLRGVPLRVRNGTRQWISFSYERLPVYCYLCGLVGHMEKKCKLRLGDGFVDPSKSFPYGEWLKVPNPGSRHTESRPMGPTGLQHQGGLWRESSIRGLQTFGFSNVGRGEVSSSRIVGDKENEMRPFLHFGMNNGIVPHKGQGNQELRMEKRSMVKPSQTKNQKKKVVEVRDMDSARPTKRQVLGDITELITIPVEAAQQPHRSI